MWRPETQAHIVGHWNYPEGTVKDMFVVSNGQAVKLYVNDKLIGMNATPENGYTFIFPKVAFEAGTIKAETYIDDVLKTTQVKETIGEAVALKLTPKTGPQGWMANGADYLLVDFETVDAQGRRHPLDQSKVTFEVKGPAVSDPLPDYMPPQPPLPINTEKRSELFTQFSYTGLEKAVLRTHAYWGKKPYIDQEVNYERRVSAGTGIIMAGNSDDDVPQDAKMYVVLGKAIQ